MVEENEKKDKNIFMKYMINVQTLESFESKKNIPECKSIINANTLENLENKEIKHKKKEDIL